jgi:hypothetical protein
MIRALQEAVSGLTSDIRDLRRSQEYTHGHEWNDVGLYNLIGAIQKELTDKLDAGQTWQSQHEMQWHPETRYPYGHDQSVDPMSGKTFGRLRTEAKVRQLETAIKVALAEDDVDSLKDLKS